MDKILYISVTGTKLKATNNIDITTHSSNWFKCSFTFDSTWAAFENKIAVFSNDRNKETTASVAIQEDNTCYIPASVLTGAGYIYIGVLHETTEEALPSEWMFVTVRPGVDTGTTPEPPDQSVYLSILGTAQEALDYATEVKNAADAGEFDGATGATGPQGEQGETGAQGEQGPTGADGADGLMIAVGDGYTLNNGSTRETLGNKAVDLTYTEDGSVGAFGDYSFAAGYGTASGVAASALSGGSVSGDISHADSGGEVEAEHGHGDSGGSVSGRYGHADSVGVVGEDGENGHADSGGLSNAYYGHGNSGGEVYGQYGHASSKGIATGHYAGASGIGTIAQGKAQTVIGEYNITQGTIDSKVDADNAFIIGNGTDGANRSNALTINWSGDLTADGDIEDGSGNVLSVIASDVETLATNNTGTNTGDQAASDVGITDSGEYFTSSNVEGALQELGAAVDGIETLLAAI